jgi:Nucleotidyl transferase AbiEii toxin, Type IV TA system
MAVSELHRQVASVALAAAAGHGFALGGGNALLAHGIISRPTQDVDLFTDQEHGVEAAADAVEAALRGAGFAVERQQADDGGLADIFPDMGQGLAEWIVSSPSGAQMVLQLAYFDRSREPEVMEIGPVLAVEDVAGGKVCALASRVEPRDYADTARMLERYSPAELIRFAQRLDPGLTAPDFADAGRQLDHIDDEAFTRYNLGPSEVAIVRQRFEAWPRTADAARLEMRASESDRQDPEAAT